MINRNKLLLTAALLVPGLAFAQISILEWSAADAMSTAIDDISLSLPTPSDQGSIRNFPGSIIMSNSISGYTENSIFAVIQTDSDGGTPVDLDTAGDHMALTPPGLWLGVDGDVPGTASIRKIAALVGFGLDTTPGATDVIGSMSFRTYSSGGIGDVFVRFAIESSGAWYVSEQVYDETFTNTTVNYDPNSSNFGLLGVADGSSTEMMAAPDTFGIAASTLDNISSVGLFFDGTTPNNTARSRIKMDLFTAAVVPEPSTYAFLFGLAALGLVYVRRRTRA